MCHPPLPRWHEPFRSAQVPEATLQTLMCDVAAMGKRKNGTLTHGFIVGLKPKRLRWTQGTAREANRQSERRSISS
jgi:hypothetical protein